MIAEARGEVASGRVAVFDDRRWRCCWRALARGL